VIADFDQSSGDTTVANNTWLQPFLDKDYTNSEIYGVALYWTITTITTVGYGDISGNTSLERAYCIVVMVTGVISFSFVNSVLASIV
jgi:hypothetical protein